MKKFNRHIPCPHCGEVMFILSPKQKLVYDYVKTNPGKGRVDIYNMLYSKRRNPPLEETVKGTIKEINSKIKFKNERIVGVSRKGYRLLEVK